MGGASEEALCSHGLGNMSQIEFGGFSKPLLEPGSLTPYCCII